MEIATQKLYMKDMTRQKLYNLFGVERVKKKSELDEWLKAKEHLTEREYNTVQVFQERLIDNIEDWNEQELSLGFIGPIINIVDFKVKYKLGFFAQRPLSAMLGEYEMIGRPDGIIASGASEPQIPYFSFHEYKKDIDSSGDPAGQNLAAMMVGQVINEAQDVVYGCYVVGRNWYFMILKDNQFAISRDYSATQEDDVIEIVGILKALKTILLKKIGAIV